LVKKESKQEGGIIKKTKIRKRKKGKGTAEN
jgi:hypothetical protein